ncbi:MAG: B12-binding domain-containing radical SAM protein [Desulfomonile tiedjei]|nr:B12-binding domain-containing radical SAM protein [Desulfomonile tiedjei]
MKVVLVRPPFYALFGVTTPKMKTYPLNLLYLATYARDKGGHEAAIVDGENISVPGLEPLGSSAQDPAILMHEGIPRMVEVLGNPEHALWVEMERRVLAEDPNLVGITCNSGNMDTARLMVARLKKHKIPVILGGSHPTVLPEQSLNYTAADMAAIGEGEPTLLRVLDAIGGKGSLEAIPSLAWRNHDRIVVNPKGKLIVSVDDLPIPDRSFIDRSNYFGEVILTGRGCPFNCAYCASRNIWGRKVRLRSVSCIIEELQMLKDRAEALDEQSPPQSSASITKDSFDHRPGRWVVKVVDDTFTVNKQRTLQLLDEIVLRGLNCFEFTGGVRADTLDENLVTRMREANFRRVTLGIESGSPRILKMIRKGETNEDVKRAVKLLREAGIHSHGFFMIGLPEETPEDIELSKKLILEVQPDHVEINMVTPYPGTDIFEKLIPEDPMKIDRWYRWFHQGMATHSERLGYDLDAAYEDFVEFARGYNARSNH